MKAGLSDCKMVDEKVLVAKIDNRIYAKNEDEHITNYCFQKEKKTNYTTELNFANKNVEQRQEKETCRSIKNLNHL